jgi:hypothetical protein
MRVVRCTCVTPNGFFSLAGDKRLHISAGRVALANGLATTLTGSQ